VDFIRGMGDPKGRRGGEGVVAPVLWVVEDLEGVVDGWNGWGPYMTKVVAPVVEISPDPPRILRTVRNSADWIT
jgi:hypothetical protein